MKSLLAKNVITTVGLLLAIISCTNKTQVSPTTTTGGTTTTTSITPANAPANANNSGHTNTEVNTWIYDTMKSNYFWADYMPDKTKTDLTKDPEGTKDDGYFYDLLYKYGTVDRNSWIQNITDLTNSLGGTNTAFGYRSTLYYIDNTNTGVGQFVTYVIAGSPMDKAGLQRGDIILSINGTAITGNNYQTVLDFSNLQTATFGLGTVDANKNIISTGKSITVTKGTFSENPVAFTKVITKGTKKIGYLLYTQFISSADNNLRAAFANFKAQGVNELVLDLRFNPGGYVSSAQTLSSLIASGVNNTKVMFSYELNATQTKLYTIADLTTYFNNEANNLGLSRLIVLGTGGTASSSELVINSLRPYIKVVLIGEQTYGKNEISQTISDGRWKWGMQPLVGRTVNSLGQSAYGITKSGTDWVFQGGITPDAGNVLKDNVIPFKPWGDETETYLAKAIDVITNTSSSARIAAAEKQGLVLQTSLKQVHLSDNPLQNRKDFVVDNNFLKKSK